MSEYIHNNMIFTGCFKNDQTVTNEYSTIFELTNHNKISLDNNYEIMEYVSSAL